MYKKNVLLKKKTENLEYVNNMLNAKVPTSSTLAHTILCNLSVYKYNSAYVFVLNILLVSRLVFRSWYILDRNWKIKPAINKRVISGSQLNSDRPDMENDIPLEL